MNRIQLVEVVCAMLAACVSCGGEKGGPDVVIDSGLDGPADSAQDTPVADTGLDVPADVSLDDAAGDAVPDPTADPGSDTTTADTAVDIEYDGCPILAPDPVDDAPLGPEAPASSLEVTLVDGFTDYYIKNGAGNLKMGIRHEWGGTIIFFGMVGTYGPGMNDTNVIDANDTGREVQVAFYDRDREFQNCAWDATCTTSPSECPNSIQFLGWNPVQGGNRCNRGSGMETWDFDSGTLGITTIPLFWNPNWDRTDCDDTACSVPSLRDRASDVTVEQTIRFVRPNVVSLEYRVTNLSDMNHVASAHEMPTIYTANGDGGPDLWRLFDSSGAEIPIDTPAGGVEGFMYENFTSPGGWAAMQDDGLTYGVGLYAENRLSSFQAWQLRSLPFNNFRPLPVFAIPAYGTIRARSYLIIGRLSDIQAEASWLDTHLPPFGWVDAPADDAVLAGTVEVAGWALDNKSVATVEVLVDGVLVSTLSYGGSRPDVCAVWPQYTACSNVGFSGTFDASILGPCGNILEVRATDHEGNSKIISRKRVFGS